MIETEEFKIAENPEEAFWKRLEEKCKEIIGQCEHEIIIQNKLLELCKEKL